VGKSPGRGKVKSSGSRPIPETGWPAWSDPLASRRLRNSIREGRIGHAYLFSGPRGVGKTRIARAFAQALCCTDLDETDRSQPCGLCRACRNVVRGAHPDVETVSLETQAMLADKPAPRGTLGIDTVRRLRASAALLPLEAPHRILIVDDAETLLEPAQQALLKTLEEPPPLVTLLLLADESDVLLETVRSRCQHIAVRPMTETHVETVLVDRGVDRALAQELAELSRGCPGWAIDATESGVLLQRRRSEWDSATTWIGASNYDRVVTAYKLGEQFSKRRPDVFGVVQAAIQILRDQMILAVAETSRSADPRPSSGSGRSALTLCKAVSASLQCLSDLEANVRPRLALEAMVLQWPSLDSR